MKIIAKTLIAAASVLALAGCAGHHDAASPKKLTAKQLSQNAIKNAFGGSMPTSHSPSLANYSLSGYGTKH